MAGPTAAVESPTGNEVTFSERTEVIPNGNNSRVNSADSTPRRRPYVVAVEEDDDLPLGDDVIPGPPSDKILKPAKENMITKILKMNSKPNNNGGRLSMSNSNGTGTGSNRLSTSFGNADRMPTSNSQDSAHCDLGDSSPREDDELNLSLTEHRIKGNGILASRADLSLSPEEFAAGCNLLQAAAAGDLKGVQELLQKRPNHVNFRDYDRQVYRARWESCAIRNTCLAHRIYLPYGRRTCLHVAASEGHLDIVKYLVEVKKTKVNRSDRWGGSALDDAHRHRHQDVVMFLRNHGGVTGSGNQSTNLITAAAGGDIDEVKMLLSSAPTQIIEKIVNKGDYDKRTSLHLAASEGHHEIVKLLCNANANVNVEDRWGSRPLDDAIKAEQTECVRILQEYGAKRSENTRSDFYDDIDKSQTRREQDNLKVDFEELEMVDRIGSGAFGEIFKCRWRGTLVAAKCIKSARIRQEWVNKRALESIEAGEDVDEAMRTMDEAELDQEEKEEAMNDFRQEIAVLKTLRHPHIVLLLAFSTTENFEVMISEVMECSLLDVFKAHHVHGTRLAKKSQISYAIQLARGMNYLHNW